jgi:K+-transporting ATPase KdpF subunit
MLENIALVLISLLLFGYLMYALLKPENLGMTKWLAGFKWSFCLVLFLITKPIGVFPPAF